MPRPSSPGPPQLVSVIIPVLNGEAHVAEQLAALAAQTYDRPWELVIADNGCSDRTLDIVHSWSARLPPLRIADATTKRGLSHARNAGAAAAEGDFLAFCDADDVATAGWLGGLTKASGQADLVGGRNEWEALNPPEVRAWRPPGPMTELYRDHNFLRYAPGGNLGVWASVAREIGWDESFTFGSSDQVFAWRAQLAGYRLGFAPDALMQLRFRRSMVGLARQYYRYGRSGAQVHLAFRGDGIPKADNRYALQHWRALVVGISDLWDSRARRGDWTRRAAFRVGRLVGCVRDRALVL